MSATKKTTKKVATKKTATKKVTTKKTAKKKAAPKKSVATSRVKRLLDKDGSIANQAEEMIRKKFGRFKNRPVNLSTFSTYTKKAIPIEGFPLQYLIGRDHLLAGTITEIIAAEGCGKTSLALSIAGMAARADSPTLYLETEGKPMDRGQARRCFDSDPDMAKRISDNAILMARVSEIREATHVLEEWVRTVRGVSLTDNGKSTDTAPLVPPSTPIVIILDTWSKLMSPSEAAGRMDYGKYSDAKGKAKKKDIGDTANMEHAVHAHALTRSLAYLLGTQNCIMIVTSHQNTRVDMSGGGGIILPENVTNLYNKTRIGGKALDQSAALQLILVNMGQAEGPSKIKIGKNIKMRVAKNSYGIEGRVLQYSLVNNYLNDVKDHEGELLRTEHPIQFSEAWSNFMAENKVWSTRVDKKRFSCEALDAQGMTHKEFYEAFENAKQHHPGLRKWYGIIDGESDSIADIVDVETYTEEEIENWIEDNEEPNKESGQ